jgi:hypothetical protein
MDSVLKLVFVVDYNKEAIIKKREGMNRLVLLFIIVAVL